MRTVPRHRTGLLAAFVIVGLVAACGGTSTSTSPSASSSALSATPPARATATISPTAGPLVSPSQAVVASTGPTITPVAACRSAQLSASVRSWDGAAGSRIALVRVINRSKTACSLSGTPRVQLLSARHTILLDSPRAHVGASDPVLDLAPGRAADTDARFANYCGPTPAKPVTVAFALPSGGPRLVATPSRNVQMNALAVPPCMGSVPGLAEMNGWRKP